MVRFALHWDGRAGGMRGIEGEQVLLRIFLGQPKKRLRAPLYREILELLRADGLAGATVVKGVAGLGRDRRIRDANIEGLFDSLPLVLEVVDTESRLEAVLPRIAALMTGGVVTLERARVIRYAQSAPSA
jgi:PII-like signaling protein